MVNGSDFINCKPLCCILFQPVVAAALEVCMLPVVEYNNTISLGLSDCFAVDN